jgi:Cu/Ag efflux pump CusA
MYLKHFAHSVPSVFTDTAIIKRCFSQKGLGSIIRTFPEVGTVFGSIGRSDSATYNAPLDTYDTTVMLKPPERVASGYDLRKTHLGNGREAPVS